jgi:hypothetical protein
LTHDLTGPLSSLAAKPGAFDVVVHARYNPEAITQYNIVPGLMGVILTMTMVLMTGLAITREQERGTMENLLSTPATALEVMTGKIVPYVMIGLVQVTLVLLLARLIFNVPMHGNLGVLYLAVLLFIAANLTLGLTFSSGGAQPAAGDADDVLLLPAVDAAVGIHVPVPRDAGLGPGDRRSAAADAFSADRSRRDVEGQRNRRRAPRDLADRGVHDGVLLIGLRTFKSTLD